MTPASSTVAHAFTPQTCNGPPSSFAAPDGAATNAARTATASAACFMPVYTIPHVEGFPFMHRETARFRDLDPMGHVNNAVFLTWIETARIEFLRRLGTFERPDTAQMEMILARVELDFRSAVEFGDDVDVAVRTGRLGTKSFDLEHVLRVGERVVAQARTVLVAYDYDRNESKEIPDEWRRRLAA